MSTIDVNNLLSQMRQMSAPPIRCAPAQGSFRT